MERFLKRKQPQAAEAEPKQAKCTPVEVAGGGKDPRSFISWNVNGLAVQLRDGWSAIKDFIEREQPDLLCLQEVRHAAAGPRGCKRGDGQKRRRDEWKRDTAQEKEDWNLIEKTFLATFSRDYLIYWSLADWKYSGTGMFVRRTMKPQTVEYTLPRLATSEYAGHKDPADPKCHPDGRVILASFKSFDVLATYAPNNGNDAASFARRAAWDDAVRKELSSRHRPIVWIGDLNCAAAKVDVTHPDWFLQQCYQGDLVDMRGQPGFTEGERRRFSELISECGLIDAYRHLHPCTEVPPAAGPHYTWRGSPPVNQPIAKYHGKAMRIDYSLISKQLLPRLQEAAIMGHGANRVGFMGSDHCPIKLVLNEDNGANPSVRDEGSCVG